MHSQLSKLKMSLTNQLDDTRKLADDESRERATILGKFRNLEHDIDGLRDGLEEEGEIKADLQRLSARLEEAESQIEGLNIKNMNLEKIRGRVSTELEDMQIEVERACTMANSASSQQKNFDKILGEWKMKVDDLGAELDASQKECRNYSTEVFRVKAAYEENLEQIDSVRRA